MNIQTGETYPTREAALAAGVPSSDIAEIARRANGRPIVKFTKGSFKSYVYDAETATLVPVVAPLATR